MNRNKKLTLTEWLNTYDGAPLDIEGIARAARLCEDHGLATRAREFLEAEEALREYLKEIDFEFG